MYRSDGDGADNRECDSPPPFLRGGGEMGELTRRFDWAATPIGAPERWSQSLRTILGVLLSSRHPMFLWWGPDFVQFYNDAYRPSLGLDSLRHPAALGARGREFWADIWPAIGPQIDGVMTRGEATWNVDHLVPITRNGRVEEVYWTYSYSPVRDDDGGIGGTLVVVQEQTDRVLAARRLRTLRDLAATAAAFRTEIEVWSNAVGALTADPRDVPWVLLYAFGEDAHDPPRVWQSGPVAGPLGCPHREPDRPAQDVVRRVADTGVPLLVEDFDALVGELIVPPWPEPVRSAWIVPVWRPHAATPYGVLVAGLSPRLPFDDAYRDFVRTAADHLASAIRNARIHEDEQRRLEELGELSAKFRVLFEQAPAGVAVLGGRDHRFEFANRIFLDITHRSDVVGLTYAEAFPEVVGTEIPGILDRVYDTGVPFVAHEYRIALERRVGSGREDYFFTFHLAPVRNAASAIVGLIAMAVDVTAQVRARRELQRAQERLEFTLDSAGVGYWDLDLSTNTTTRSLRHDQILGHPLGVDKWTFETLLSHVEPNERGRVADAVRASIAEGHDLLFECPIRGADGQRRWIQVRGRIERDVGGVASHLLGIVVDITERRDLFEREQAARQAAEHASHAKDRFLATLSHELRTPVNTIIGWSDLLGEDGLDPATIREGLSTIQRHARAQARMVEDLLDMGRIVSGKVHVNARVVALADVVVQAVASVTLAARAKGVRLDFPTPGQEEVVWGDAALLQQVFWNLLGNAVKFTPSGGVVDISFRQTEAHVHASIRDTGEGLAPEFLPHVFERFRQENDTATRPHGGLGIGLSIARQLIEAHGGIVTAASPGKGLGSTFTVSLPLAPPQPGGRTHESSAAGPASTLTRLVGARLLVVDDDAETRELLERIFTGCRANVVTAESAAEALGALSQHPFDLLISDIGMPHEDGFDLIRKIRSMVQRPAAMIPAVALTAYARPEDRLRALDAGFQVHVAKPINRRELLSVCAGLIPPSG